MNDLTLGEEARQLRFSLLLKLVPTLEGYAEAYKFASTTYVDETAKKLESTIVSVLKGITELQTELQDLLDLSIGENEFDTDK
jgi:hypothetical protein